MMQAENHIEARKSADLPFQLSPRQLRVYEALKERNSNLATMYLGGHYALKNIENPDHIAQASHSFRELMEKAPAWIEGLSEPGSVARSASNRKDQYAKMRSDLDPIDISPSDRSIRALKNEWGDINDFMQSVSHHGILSIEKEYIDENVTRLDRVLEDILAPEIARDHANLDSFIVEAEKNIVDLEAASSALDRIKRGADRIHFFQQINSTDWIRPLYDEGAFDSISARSENEGYVSFPPWPEGLHLLRMAKEATEEDVQTLILEVLKSLPETDNLEAIATQYQIALALPPLLAKQWAKDDLMSYLRNEPYIHPLLTEKTFDLAIYLAKAGEIFVALYLVEAILDICCQSDSEENFGLATVREEMKVDPSSYHVLVLKRLPELTAVIDIKEVLSKFLCRLLNKAIECHVPLADGHDDTSYLHWRPKIEAEPDSGGYHSYGFLATALVNAIVQAAENEPERVPEMVEILESVDPPRAVFQRAAYYVLLQFPEHARETIAERLVHVGHLNEDTTWREYAMLLKSQFSALNADQKQKLLGFIQEGPPTSERGKGIDDETWKKRSDYWQWRRLELLRGQLPDGVAENRRESLVETYGECTDPVNKYDGIKVIWGSEEEAHIREELENMPPSNVAAFLSTELSTRSFRSFRDAGSALATVVKANASAFAAVANGFRSLDPTFVRELLSGLENAEEPFDWDPVLALCEWVLDQPRELNEEQVDSRSRKDLDPDWGLTRKRIASLFRKGLAGDKKSIAFEQRERVWNIIERLTHDPEPTPEYEETYGGGNMDPLTLSLNTVRGEAMNAVVLYAWWVHEHTVDENADQKPVREGLNEMPEVREVLDAHLDLAKDPSLAVRAVYGCWFPQLYWIDVDWSTNHVADIFPIDEKQLEYFEASWNAYLFRSKPYDYLFKLLQDQYLAAVGQLSDVADDDIKENRSLIQHLVIFFLRGGVVLGDGGVFDRFLERASPTLRRYAVTYMGEYLKSVDDNTRSEKTLERMREFWESRLSTAEKGKDIEPFREELEWFGSWFASGVFEDGWAIEQLHRTLALTRAAVPLHPVMEHLASLAPTYPIEAVQCIKYLAERKVNWMYRRDDPTEKVLEAILHSDNQDAAKEAKQVINVLMAKGYLDLRKLITT